MFAEVTFGAIDLVTLLPLLIKIGIPLLMLFLPQLKQPIVSILQSLLDALSDMPTVLKSSNLPNDAQTMRAWKTLRRRATCEAHAKAVDAAGMDALAGKAEQPK
jgi:hypothetical protein